ncbi:MAG: hypothetical protein M3066_01300 [Actinomycetota bacterium]|nr:hypothetical protein [Actinomycetota bacterium]
MWQTERGREDAPAGPTGALPPVATSRQGGSGPTGADRWFPVLAFASVAGAVIAISVAAHGLLAPMHVHHRSFQGRRWYHAFTWWDGWWYTGIARRGYRFFSMDRQSPVAFFPAYPLLMRWLAPWGGGPVLAGIGLTVASGMGAAILLHRWCARVLSLRTARIAVLLLLLYPFAFYLMGAVYGDALFLFATLAAFVALEYDRPVVAGLAAALATSTRPVGVAVILGLWVVALERKGVVRGRGPRRAQGWAEVRSRFTSADAGLLLAPVGLAGFCAFLWIRFGRPLAFMDTAGARGWDQPPGFHTWFKVHWVKAMWYGPWITGHVGHLGMNALATAVVAAFIPLVFRRLGVGYGVFAVVAVLLTAVSTKDFVGMGRYTLAAFPCFAVAAEWLSRRPRLLWSTVAVFALGLALLSELHARGTIVS